MKQRRIPLSAVRLAATAILVLLLSISAGAEGIAFEPYDFESRSGETVAAELGEIQVPENRQADGRKIKLRFVRFPSTAEKPGAPIVYLAGGPGGSGIETARGRRFPLFMALRAHADVIAFDQRGTGLSNDIEPCRPKAQYPLNKPLEREPLLRMLESATGECAAQWKSQGVDLEGYDTAESAEDLEELRRALGVPKITLWGISYGTHLAFAAARRHPEGIESLILASAEGPDETVKLPSRTQDFLGRVHALTQQDEGLKKIMPDFLGTMEAVLARLEKEPMVVTTRDRRSGETVELAVGRLDLQLLTGYSIKNPDTLRHLPLLFLAAAGGDLSMAAPHLLGLRGYLTSFRGMPEAMDAASGMSASRRARILAERDDALLGDTLNFPVLPDWSFSSALGVSELPTSFRSRLESDIPALFLSGTLDGRTYPASHRELADGFSKASFVSIVGAGHDLFLSSPEVERRMLDFLARGSTSEEPIVLPTLTFSNPSEFQH